MLTARLPNSKRAGSEWLKFQSKKRVARLEEGNFGEPILGEGVFELRLHFGAGYRIYFGEINHGSPSALRW